MSFVAAFVLAALARVETVNVVTIDSRPALRIAVSGQPSEVVLRQDGASVRLVMKGVELGRRFGRGRRVRWDAADAGSPRWLSGRSPSIDHIELEAAARSVVAEFRGPSKTVADLRREPKGLLIVLAETTNASSATAPQAVSLPTPDTAALLARLFPDRAETQATSDSIRDLYSRLFPSAPPESAGSSGPLPGRETAGGGRRIGAAASARYVAADTFLRSAAERKRDQYLELSPRLLFDAPVGPVQLSGEYAPSLRKLATQDQVNSDTHDLNGRVKAALTETVQVYAGDRYVAGTLDTRIVDPGGEYFFGLAAFRRNEVVAGGSVLLGPRTSIEVSGSTMSLRFLETSSFFGYHSRSATLGVGFELTPNLKAVSSYGYDTVASPSSRPQAGSQAHSARLSLTGDILPLLSGDIALGYRLQRNPEAGEGGRRYSGLTLSGTLTRHLAPESTLSFHVVRTTLPSAYGSNGYYLFNAVEAAAQLPFWLDCQARFGIGHQWNDYPTRAADGGELRRDRILGWFLGLRRSLGRGWSASIAFRAEDRRSNNRELKARSSGLVVQLDWQAFAKVGR